MAKIKIKKNKRNFDVATFTDHYGSVCSIQKSSLADKDCIWVGVDNADPKIMSSDAIRLGLRKRTFDENDNGWIKFEIPKEVLISTRMHLTRKHVKALLPILQRFVESGNIS
jgi:acid phosphatase class B